MILYTHHLDIVRPHGIFWFRLPQPYHNGYTPLGKNCLGDPYTTNVHSTCMCGYPLVEYDLQRPPLNRGKSASMFQHPNNNEDPHFHDNQQSTPTSNSPPTFHALPKDNNNNNVTTESVILSSLDTTEMLFKIANDSLIDEDKWVEVSRECIERIKGSRKIRKCKVEYGETYSDPCKLIMRKMKIKLYHMPIEVVMNDVIEEINWNVDPSCFLDLTYGQSDSLSKTEKVLNLIDESCSQLIFAITTRGIIRVARNPVDGQRITHSQLASGDSVYAAGKIVFKENKIVELNNDSGHYKPFDMSVIPLVEKFLRYLLEGGKCIFADHVSHRDVLSKKIKNDKDNCQ